MAAPIEPESSERQGKPGFVEGRLLVSSVGESGVCYAVLRFGAGRPVECDVPKHLKRAATDALAQWVRVSGTIYPDAAGAPAMVKVARLKALPKDHDLPTLDEIGGSISDITNGLKADEFVGIMRDADAYYHYTGNG